MVPKISDICMFLTTTKEIWDVIQQTYSKKNHSTQRYDIKIKLITIQQGSCFVIEYTNILKNLWQEMDYYRCITMKNSGDVVTLKLHLKG